MFALFNTIQWIWEAEKELWKMCGERCSQSEKKVGLGERRPVFLVYVSDLLFDLRKITSYLWSSIFSFLKYRWLKSRVTDWGLQTKSVRQLSQVKSEKGDPRFYKYLISLIPLIFKKHSLNSMCLRYTDQQDIPNSCFHCFLLSGGSKQHAINNCIKHYQVVIRTMKNKIMKGQG